MPYIHFSVRQLLENGVDILTLSPTKRSIFSKVANVGDSRAYIYKDGEITQVTKDDSKVQMLYDRGEISSKEENEPCVLNKGSFSVLFTEIDVHISNWTE